MLAQGSSRDLLASESEARKAFSMGMDLSPSQLVINPAQPLSLELQSLIIEAQGQGNGGPLQTLPLDQRLLLQSLISPEFGNSSFIATDSSQAPPSAGDFSTFPSSSSAHPINVGELQPSPVMSNAITNATGSSTSGTSASRSSSASLDNQYAAAYSRRPGSSSSNSPKSAPADALSFGRISQAARQRTAQACEKCRDRKTKCSGTKPVCKRCSDRGLTCVWAPDTRIRGVARQSRQTRVELGDNTGEAISSLPVALESSTAPSPSLHGRNLINSAPAYQTTFPAISPPSHLIVKDQQKRQSWHDGAFPTGVVARGIHAHSILGGPIRPITSVDDCWISIDGCLGSTADVSGRDFSSSISPPRERRNSISFANIPRARSRDEPLASSEGRVSGSPETCRNAHTLPSHNKATSPLNTDEPRRVSSSETSESEPSPSLISSRHSFAAGNDLHQPLPSYGVGTRLSNEMINLLNFPGLLDMNFDEQEFLDGFGSFTFENSDLNKVYSSPSAIHELDAIDNAEAVFAQYLDADAFARMHD